MWGELFALLRLNRFEFGSSPRVGGIVYLSKLVEGMGRIIPACGGNWAEANETISVMPDHPRVWGELVERTLVEIT